MKSKILWLAVAVLCVSLSQAALISNGDLNTAVTKYVASPYGDSTFTLDTTTGDVTETEGATAIPGGTRVTDVDENQWLWTALTRVPAYSETGGKDGTGGFKDGPYSVNQKARAVAQFANDGGAAKGEATISMDVYLDDNTASNALKLYVELYAWNAGQTAPGLSLGGAVANSTNYNVTELGDADTILTTEILAADMADAAWETVELATVNLGSGYDYYVWRIGVVGETDGDFFAFDNVTVAVRGAAHSPLPDGDDIVDPTVYSSVSWYNAEQDANGDFLDDPNIVSIDGYDVWWSAGVEPNYLTDTPTYQAAPDQDYTPTPAITYDTTYYWRVDTYITWDSNDFTGTASLSSVVQGLPWSFTTDVEDKVPVVTLSNYVTWPEELPDDIVADVNYVDEIDDIASVDWEITAGQGIPTPADMEMMDRDTDNIKSPYDPNLYRDWIGTDLKTANKTSNVLNLTLSGLPAGSYTWTSYHYDAFRLGTLPLPTFDVTVTVNSVPPVSTTTTDVAQSNGDTDEFPPAAFTTSFTSDGSDVTLQFVGPADYRALADADDPDKHAGLFAMNAFELTGSGDPLYVDFGSDPNHKGQFYDEYLATNGDPETFIAQAFSAFGATVTVKPDWDAPGLEITSYSGTTPTSTATVDTTDAPHVLGTYTIKVTATENGDDGNEPQADSKTMTINVVEDGCAAKLVLDPDFELDAGDIDQNCLVNLADLAVLAEQWLVNDYRLTGTTPY